jgi:hypothetical protein
MKIILLINLFIGISVSLKQNEICKNSQQECKGKYNSFNHYVIICNQVKCHGNHPFKCNHIYCTKNAKSCIDFYNLNRPSASMLKLPQRTNKHSMYESKIKDCDSENYKRNEKDACLNGKNCILFDRTSKSLVKKILCPCKRKYNYHCGNNYCTTNNVVCKHLFSSYSMNKISSFNISKCMNDNQIIKTSLF